MSDRKELHRIIDKLPASKLPVAGKLLKRIYEEDELELNDQTKKEIEEARRQIKNGEYLTIDELLEDVDPNV